MSSFSESITIHTQPQKVWDTLADIGSIAVWNPGVSESHQSSEGPAELGATRHCRLGGNNYLDEQVTTWRPGEAITFRIIDTNLPFKGADIRFTMRSEDDKTVVSVSPDYTLKYGALGALLDRLIVRKQYKNGMAALLRGLKKHLEHPPTP